MLNYDNGSRGNSSGHAIRYSGGSLPSFMAIVAVVSILIIGMAYDNEGHWMASDGATAHRAAAVDTYSPTASISVTPPGTSR
jgi:ABC-type cobalt transport system substrate-binding protein